MSEQFAPTNDKSLDKKIRAYEKQQKQKEMLKASTAPLSFKEMVEHTDYSYVPLRRMLSRMHAAGEIASPSRGLYTAPGHACLTQNVTHTNDIPLDQSRTVD